MAEPTLLRVGQWYYSTEQDKLLKLDHKGQLVEVCQLDNLAQKVITYFIRNPGILISKEQLLEDVWGIRDVTDGRIARVIKVLRARLGDDSKLPTYIETIPKRGYRFIAHVALVQNPKGYQHATIQSPQPSNSRILKVTLGAFVTGVLIIAITLLTIKLTETPKIYATLQYQGVTSLDGLEYYHNLSPDENLLVFTHADNDTDGQVLKLLNLKTHQLTTLTSLHYLSFGAAFNPLSNQIAYQRMNTEGLCDIHIMTLNEDRTHPLSDEKVTNCGKLQISARLDWSPDGRHLLYQSVEPTQNQIVLMLLPLYGGQPEQLTVPPMSSLGDFAGRFSRNGDHIAFLRSTSAVTQIWLLDLNTRSSRLLTTLRDMNPGNITWSLDDKSILFPASETSLSKVDIKSGEVTWVAQTNQTAFELQLAKSDTLYVSSGLFSRINILRHTNPLTQHPLTIDTVYSSNRNETYVEANTKSDGPTAVVSRRSGYPQIWLFYPNGTQRQLSQFTHNERIRSLSFSPDGQRIVTQLTNQIWIFELDGTSKHIAGSDERSAAHPGFSKNGEEIYYVEPHQGRWQSVSVAIEDPSNKKVLIPDADFYSESSLSDYSVWRDSNTKQFYIRFTDHAAEQLPFKVHDAQMHINMDLRPSGIYYSLMQDTQNFELMFYDFSTQQTKVALPDIPLLHSRFSLSSDERYFYYLESQKADIDITKIDNFTAKTKR